MTADSQKPLPPGTKRINHPVFGNTRTATPGEQATIKRLLTDVPLVVFSLMNVGFNGAGCCLTIGRLPKGDPSAGTPPADDVHLPPLQEDGS